MVNFGQRKQTLSDNWADICKRKQEQKESEIVENGFRYLCQSCNWEFRSELDHKSVFCPNCNSTEITDMDIMRVTKITTINCKCGQRITVHLRAAAKSNQRRKVIMDSWYCSVCGNNMPRREVQGYEDLFEENSRPSNTLL